MDIKELLELWGLTHLLPKFEEQRINADVLTLLTPEEIQLLTDNIGDKLRLVRGIRQLLEGPEKSHDLQPLKKFKSGAITIDEVSNEEQSNHPQLLQIQNLPVIIVPDTDDERTSQEIDFSQQDLISMTATTETVSSGYSDLASSSSNTSFRPGSVLNNFDLTEFIKTDIFGQALLVKAQREGLANVDRDRLADLLVRPLMNKHGKLSSDDFETLSNKIAEIFPREKSSTYYVPAIRKNISTRHQSEKARGKLIDKQRNLLHLLRLLSKSDAYDVNSEGTTSNIPNETNHVEDEETLQSHRDSQIWLKRNIEPTAEVIKHWKNSHSIRKICKAETIANFIEDLVPENDEVWNFYILTMQILHNLLSRSFSHKSIEYLSTLIEEHHSLVISLFNEHLRPKYHILLHYPGIIKLLGPPRYYWSMRYESFHRLLKCTANSVTCRRNLLVTLSIKQQLRFSSRVLSKKGLVLSTDHGPSKCLSENILNNFPDYFTKRAVEVSWVNTEFFYYKVGFVLQILKENLKTSFVLIRHIILDKNSILFLTCHLENIGFYSHMQCYEIEVPIKNQRFSIKSFVSLDFKYLYNMHYTGNGKTVVCTFN